MNRALGPQRIDAANGLFQDSFVEEENGVEGLVLAAGGDAILASQVGEEAFYLFLTGKLLGNFG